MSVDESRSRRLLSDPDVVRWYTNLREGSELTADIYLRRLDMICDVFGRTHRELARLDARSAYDFLVDLVAAYRKKGVAGSTIKGYVKPIKSWFTHNDIIITKPIRIRGANKTPTLKDEKTPEPYELNSVWKFCKPRQEVEISFIGFSGVRPEVLGNYHGYDGLRLADLPELVYDNHRQQVLFKAIPTRVLVRYDLSKIGYDYETFLCEEGCNRLEKYLVSRLRTGEVLGPQSAVVAEALGGGRPLSTKTVCEDVRAAFRAAGFSWRPYILRRYFDTRMGQASAKPETGLPDAWVTFWMGHGGDIEALYRLHKRLPDSLLEQMRTAYQRASVTTLQSIELFRDNAETIRREFRAVALRSVGFRDDEIKHVDFGRLTAEEFQELVKKKLGGDLPQADVRQQIVVTAEEAEDYINFKGWTCVQSLANGKVVIESPASGPKPSGAQATHPAIADPAGSGPLFERGRPVRASSVPKP